MNYYYAASQYNVRSLDATYFTDRVLSVCHTSEPYKNVQPNEMPFGLWAWMGPMNHVLDGRLGVQIPMGRGNFKGQGWPVVKRCTKTAEPIEMLFGIWTRVGLKEVYIRWSSDAVRRINF